MDLILASGSPRRSKILSSVGYVFSVLPSEFDESRISLENPRKGVEALAFEKANQVFQSLPPVTKLGSVVLGADTIVVCDGEVLLKPSSEEEAKKMLMKLSGKKHQVYTAFSLVSVSDSETFTEKTDVYFYDLTEEQIDEYIATREPMDKAGAYGIQGAGCLLVKKIDGDYFNVVGLPIARVSRSLERYGIYPLR